MRSVGDELWKTDTNIEAILEKRQEITTHEIVTLLEEGVTKKKIREALGMHSVIEFREFISTIAQKMKGEFKMKLLEDTINAIVMQEYKIKRLLKEIGRTDG